MSALVPSSKLRQDQLDAKTIESVLLGLPPRSPGITWDQIGVPTAARFYAGLRELRRRYAGQSATPICERRGSQLGLYRFSSDPDEGAAWLSSLGRGAQGTLLTMVDGMSSYVNATSPATPEGQAIRIRYRKWAKQTAKLERLLAA
jgi:hypothetical protein